MMKRLISIMVVLMMLILFIPASPAQVDEGVHLNAGDTFVFGYYEQDNNVENGEEPIEWVVLAKDGQKALLLSKHSLDYQAYHWEKGTLTWESSALRNWLNTTFLQSAFSLAELDAVITTSVSNANEQNNPEWETAGGNETQDRVFLLSYEEVASYFEQQDARKNIGSEHAKALGAKVWPLEETDWWLRSPGKVQQDACYIGSNGGYHSHSVTSKKGIRPALWFDFSVSQENFPAKRYADATALFGNGQHAEAAIMFEGLGTYYDSPTRVKECKYAQAGALMQTGEYDEAIRIFEVLDSYSDSNEQARECRYLQAVAAQDGGNTAEAIKLLSRLGHYKDSMARLKNSFSAEGISLYYSSEAAVNAGTDTGYAKAAVIGASDSHFGWRLGRFLMSGFTRVSEDKSANPIFIKTLGDKVTLWFDLEQDINQLNGNENLSIAEDNNGYDEYFGVVKTNFGRGTLIVRHKDYQNAMGDPVIYTDFLAAKGSYGAETKVELFEEGDYEVTLNYETVSKSYGVLSNFANYRIRFNFAVRNGNTMIFPFDVATGAELSNSTVTENGFYLDLAKSRYLDINIKRSVLTEGVGGLVEDQRFNRPAKDGDRYTQEGIYTITVLNRYTGEQTEKQIFVGTNDLLNQYIDKGLFTKN